LLTAVDGVIESAMGTTCLRDPRPARSAHRGLACEQHLERRLRPMARSGTIGVEQKRPMRTPGVAKVAVSAASGRGGDERQPAAVAPRTRHHGCGSAQPQHRRCDGEQPSS
jgi:hypothetical protein